MKVRISDNKIVDISAVVDIELDERILTLILPSGKESTAIYRTEAEAMFVFNNIVREQNVSDYRFITDPDSEDEDDRKERGFDMFWNLYDKKVDIKRAKTAFMNLTLADMRLAVAGVKSYIESTPDKKYRKNPTTWLNQRGWESEVVKKESDKPQPNRYVKPTYVSDDR
tara:strand:- start:161 stop:667 length:507 start_codon:yes stop_codon:yes gene_type:complete